MRIVMYKTPDAIFDFLLPDVIDHLEYYSDRNVREATEIPDAIISSPSKVRYCNNTIQTEPTFPFRRYPWKNDIIL